MPEVILGFSKGRKTSGNELQFEPGFADKLQNAVFNPDDDHFVHKIPGRTEAADLPGAATTSNTKNFAYLRFNNNSNYLALLANTQLYQATAGETLGSWASVNDLAATAFPRSGDFLKSIPDGLRRNIVWSGAASERPLIRDEDGNWRFMSLKKPDPPVVTLLTAAPSLISPNATSNPATVSEGTVNANFTNASRAFDNDRATFASARRSTAGISASDFTFAAAVLGADYKLNIKVASSSLTPFTPGFEDYPLGDFDNPEVRESLRAKYIIQVSIDGGTNYTTIYSQAIPIVAGTIQFDLASGQQMSNVRVRAIYVYTSGTVSASALLYEIWAQANTTGNANVLTAGTHYYVVVESYAVTLASGQVVVVQSAPSDAVSAVLNGTTHRGVSLALAALANVAADGVLNSATDKRILTRRIFRTTGTGAWPNLGYIGDASSTATTFVDDFSVGVSTLGSPGLSVVHVGDSVYPLATQGPAFLDATLHRGSVVAIPKTDPTLISWTPPGFPEYWPVPQAFPLASRESNVDCTGVLSLGEIGLIVWTRTQTIRLRNLPMATSPNFNIEDIEQDVLSPSEGLAGSPLSYCLFHSQKGHRAVAWVSDSGIWMTDGSLVSERGMGCVKLSAHKNWSGDVDTERLDETQLSFDPVRQEICFDYYDNDGVRQHERMHTGGLHWVATGQDQAVPIWSGPHTLTANGRLNGEDAGVKRHWTLSIPNLKVYSERVGTQDDGNDILTHIESVWVQPAGPRNETQIYAGSMFHSDWQANEQCVLDILVREDQSGIIQTDHHSDVSLRGKRATELGLVEGSGQSFKAIIRHKGKTTSSGKPVRGFGPVVLEVERVDEIRKE